ncbi:MAG: outer membrane protein transport protein, partial [Pseudomonadota bacterium]
MNKVLVVTTLFCASTLVHAGGYRVSLQGQRAQGMGHTGVALTDSAESIFFNPGSTVLLDSDREFIGGLNLLSATAKYQNVNTGASAETDSGIATPLNLYYNSKVSDSLSWGLGIYTPYGSSVKWP